MFFFFRKNKKSDIGQKEKTQSLNYCETIVSSEPKYQSIEEIIHILCTEGFILKYITTCGECSGHDCIDELHCEYSSIEEFKKNVYKDFEEKEQRIKDSAELSWTTTMFVLYNKDLDFRIVLSISEDNGSRVPCNSYLSFRRENTNETDKKNFEQLLTKLKDYIIKK